MKDRFRLMGNFLATDDVPDTLFWFKIVADEKDYTEEDRAFFKEHPEAGGYYDLEDGTDEPDEAEEPGETQGASKGGDSRKVPFDPDKDRLKVPQGREKEFEAYMDKLASLFNPVVWDEKNDRPVLKNDGKTFLGKDPSRPASNLVPPDWRERQGKGEFDRDYDYVAAFLAGAEPGINPSDNAWHMGDVGKMPTHETFSNESYYARDPKWAPYAGRWEGETFIPPQKADDKQKGARK